MRATRRDVLRGITCGFSAGALSLLAARRAAGQRLIEFVVADAQAREP